MKKGREDHWEEEGYSLAKRLHDSAYFSGFHLGRHKEREMLVNSGWLQINPEKKEEIQKALEDPCKYCEHYTQEYKKGCSKDPTKCSKKQLQMNAIEILAYFK